MILNLRFRKFVGPFFAISAMAMGALWLLGIERESSIAFTPLPPRQMVHLDSFWSALPPEQNLTYRAAEGFALELFASTPFNPMATTDDLMATINPDQLIAAMMQSIGQVPMQPFPSLALAELRVSPNDTPEHRRAYLQSLTSALNRTIGTQAGSVTTADAFIAGLKEDRSQLNIPLERHNNAIASLGAMPVPESLAPLHKQIIDFLAKSNAMIQNTAALENDPLRSLRALQSVPLLLEEARIINQEISSAVEREQLAMNPWERALGFNVAYAGGLPVFDAMQFFQMIWEYIQDFMVEFLKTKALTSLKNNILTFVQGAANAHCPNPTIEGFEQLCPKFVTNWTNMFSQAVRAAHAAVSDEIDAAWQGTGRPPIGEAGDVQGRIQERLPRGLYLAIQNVITPPGSFADITRNVTVNDCANNPDPIMQVLCFTNIENLPGTNFTRAVQRAQQVAEAKARATEAEMAAGQGFLGTRQCARWDSEERVCLQWTTTEPGTVTREITTKSNDMSFERILSTENLAGAVANVLIGFLDQFLTQALEDMGGAVQRAVQPNVPIEAVEPTPTVRPRGSGLLGLQRQPTPTPPPLPGPVSIRLTASPQTIMPGQSSTISWSSENALGCHFGGQRDNVDLLETSSSKVVSPETTTTYTIRCANAVGRSASASVTVYVGVPIIITLSANPASITLGETTTLSWSVSGVEGESPCVASGDWSGARPSSGSLGVSPTRTSTYTLTCSREEATEINSVTVTVITPEQ